MYLIPSPARLEEREGSFMLSYEGYVTAEASCSHKVSKQTILLQKALKKILGYELFVTRGNGQKGDIVLRQDEKAASESYTLEIKDDGVWITGDEAGLWHGMQTLLQIVEQNGVFLPCLRIEDAPAVPNRGFYHDVTRGRIPTLEYLKKVVDRMAYYKLNQLQLYIEHSFLFRGMSELWRDDTPLTAEEIMELDAYCLERGIELVPSLSSFGHLYKLLSTKQWCHLCELEESEKQPYSYRGRMHHHTIDASNPESIRLLKSMISQFIPLFTSRQFNICADETFDLGTGKSKAECERLGKPEFYIRHVNELCAFLVEQGIRPMFWGDIIWGFPEKIRELPKETVCLNWGYMKEQREDETRWVAETGATQYTCPGCCAWNQFVSFLEYTYSNVSRMCSYAIKYKAIGVLNTDWGDFGHINHPEFSAVGMIYGAAFSWNSKIPSFEEINRQISVLEFKDSSGTFLETVNGLNDTSCSFEWATSVRFMEQYRCPEYKEEHEQYIRERVDDLLLADRRTARVAEVKKAILAHTMKLAPEKRDCVNAYVLAADAIMIWNDMGKVVASRAFGKTVKNLPDGYLLAERLETWFYYYKRLWRSVSKEAELYRLQEIICWYADYLREK